MFFDFKHSKLKRESAPERTKKEKIKIAKKLEAGDRLEDLGALKKMNRNGTSDPLFRITFIRDSADWQ